MLLTLPFTLWGLSSEAIFVLQVTSPFPPSDKIGIKSVQREDELIVPMKEMKMGWVPYLPPQVREYVQIFTPIYFFLWYHGGGPICFVVLRVTCSYACYCSNSAVERYKAQVFTLKCTQRRWVFFLSLPQKYSSTWFLPSTLYFPLKRHIFYKVEQLPSAFQVSLCLPLNLVMRCNRNLWLYKMWLSCEIIWNCEPRQLNFQP
jgi:hypothetical protein